MEQNCVAIYTMIFHKWEICGIIWENNYSFEDHYSQDTENNTMHYHHITTATFLSRPNRFIAQVRLFDGTEETVHVKNTGRCRELLIPGCTVYLEKSENPNRKTLYDLVAVEKRYDQVSNWENYPLVFRKRMKNGMEKSLLFNIDSKRQTKLC